MCKDAEFSWPFCSRFQHAFGQSDHTKKSLSELRLQGNMQILRILVEWNCPVNIDAQASAREKQRQTDREREREVNGQSGDQLFGPQQQREPGIFSHTIR